MHKTDTTDIYFAPLQELTDYVYRKSYSRIFKGITKFFTPYIVRQNDGSIKKSHLRDISPANNPDYDLVPQIMAGNSEDFIFLAKTISDLGYREINWNLGCPYPMVTNRGMGAGLLPNADKIEEILSKSLPKLTCRFSVKLRSGLNSSQEIFKVLPVLNQFPLSEIILHPRIAKQLYKGLADQKMFQSASAYSNHPMIYNGDITNIEDVKDLTFKGKLMIGRGLLRDPFLAENITGNANHNYTEKIQKLINLHDLVYHEYSIVQNGKSHLITKMFKFWTYFCFSFPDPHKSLKRIKKAGSIEKYESAVRENFNILKHS